MSALPFSREELLSQTARLHALARQLGLQFADAEDAAQRTWLQALCALPRGVQNWRPFLATTLRNVVGLTGRAERRRIARDQRVGAMHHGEAESTDELVARLELHRRLAAFVLELPEPQRDLVMRHYFGGEPLTDLAQRAGTSDAAVRGHLHRARATLRERLEALDRERRRDGLAGLAFLPSLAVAGAIPAMKSKTWIVVAVLMLAALGVWPLLGNRDDSQGPGQGPPALAVANLPDTAAEGTSDARSSSASERVAVAAPELPWVVRGEVMHGSVAPLPHASFTARVFAGYEALGEPLLETVLTSDAEGAFAWPLPAPAGAVTLTFAQQRSDTRIMSSPRTCRADDAPPQDLLVFAFRRDCRVTGTVTDAANRPIAGAWVNSEWRDPPQPCAADGSFALLTSATYGETRVIAGAPGHLLQSRSVRTRSGASVAMDFRLEPAASLSGRVVNEAGEPVGGATVFTSETYWARAKTDASGAFTLDHLGSARGEHHVTVEHPEYLTQQLTLTADTAPLRDLVLKRGSPVRGRVVGPDGRAVAGAHVHVGDWIGYLGKPAAVSQDDGTFEVRNVEAGRAQLRVYARGCAPSQRFLEVPAASAQPLTLEVRLERGHFVAGRVVDDRGLGVHRVRVTPQVGSKRVERMQLGGDVYTARDGSFRIEDLPGEPITLDCFGMDVARREESNVAVDRSDVLIVMQRAARLAGRVVDDATGQPIPKFTIRLRGGHGYGVEWVRGLTFEDASGTWNTAGERFDDGLEFDVQAAADGYGPVEMRAVARRDADANAFVLRLRKAARVAGRVVDQRTGAGIAGAQVAVLPRGDAPQHRGDPFEAGALAGRTGGDGSFTLEGLPAGEITLGVKHPDWPLTIDGPFAVEASGAADRVIAVAVAATVRGTVLDPNGHPLAGVEITRETAVIRGLPVRDAKATSDAAGRVVFGGMPTARYWLRGSGRMADGSVVVYSRGIDVTAGRDLELSLAPAGTGALQLDLEANGKLPDAMSLRIVMTADESLEGTFAATLSGASTVVRGLPAGACRFFVHCADGSIAHGEATVRAATASRVAVRASVPTSTRR